MEHIRSIVWEVLAGTTRPTAEQQKTIRLRRGELERQLKELGEDVNNVKVSKRAKNTTPQDFK